MPADVKVTGPKGGLIARHIPTGKLAALVPGWLRRFKHVTLTPVPAPEGEFAMFDSVTVSAIPPGAFAVAGYVNGHWPTFPELQRSFPHARKLSIAVTAAADADCLDVEQGDATVQQAPAWVHRQHARGLPRPAVYCSLSVAPSLLFELAQARIPRASVRLFTAHYTDRAHRCDHRCDRAMPTVADATQWTCKALGRNLDESLCAPDFLAAP